MKYTAYDRGRDDYREFGIPLEENPYDFRDNDEEYEDWKDGWLYEQQNLTLENHMHV